MNWKALSSAMRTFYQSDYNGLKLILNKHSYYSSLRNIFSPFKRGGIRHLRPRWSTSPLVFFSWLLDHVIYLKLRKKYITLCKAQQIHKIQKLFSLKMVKVVILSENGCHFVSCSTCNNSNFLLSLR